MLTGKVMAKWLHCLIVKWLDGSWLGSGAGVSKTIQQCSNAAM
jgi:hypothetical protein